MQAAYSIKIYRLGYYQGDGARLITTINPSASLPQNQPACATDPDTADLRLWHLGGIGLLERAEHRSVGRLHRPLDQV